MTPEHSVPRTAAGRALLESVHAVCYHAWGECPAENRILAIEAEADAEMIRTAVFRDRERIWQALGTIGLGEDAPWDAISALLDEAP